MKIFGWLADHSGCGWYRVILPLGALREHGHETFWAGRFADEDMWESDVVIAQRVCLPGPTGLYQRILKHKGKRPKMVFELDDDLWNIDRANMARTFYSDRQVRENLITNIRMADAVTVSTEPLAEICRQWNTEVYVLPNGVPTQLLAWEHGRFTDRTTIGWQGSPTHNGDWVGTANPIERWFNKISDEHPLEMHTLGDIPSKFPDVLPHRHTPWEGSVERYYRAVDWHIALAPLADTPFNHSKSDLRVLEAAMLGIPSIASARDSYARFIEDGVDGLLVHKPSDWGGHLSYLIEHPDERIEMGRRAREKAATRTVEATALNWLKAYQS